MADISWIKLKTTMFDDEKIRLIQSLPEADAILVVWVRLLVLAGKTNDDGLIYIQRNMPYTDEMLATLFSKPVNVIRLALNTLCSFEMIDLGEDGLIAITNWERHQNVNGMDKVRELNAKRNKAYRERKKQMKLESDVTVTSRDATDIDKELDLDIEQDKEKDKDNTVNSPDGEKVTLQDRFNVIWALYPNKKGKDKAFTAYKKAVKDGTSDDEIVNGINAYKKEIEIKNTDQAYILHGSTYFNGKRWTDVYVDKPTVKKSFGYERTEEEEDYPF